MIFHYWVEILAVIQLINLIDWKLNTYYLEQNRTIIKIK